MRSHCFRDFDAFASSVRDVDAVMMLENASRHLWTICQLDLSGIEVQLGSLGSGNIVEGQSWSNGYLLYLPLTDACAYAANGTVLDKHSVLILEPGCEFCLNTRAEHDWCSIFVPTDKLVHGGELSQPFSGSDKMKCRVSPANRLLADQFRSIVRQIITAAGISPQIETGPAAVCATAGLLRVASKVLGQRRAGEAHHEGRPRVSRQRIIRCCGQLLEERHGEPVHVGELATTAGVSERTLRTAFHEYYGVGPLRYLQLKQLHQVHRALRAADPESESVTGVLTGQGVWQFGRFATRYHRLFDELPSATLQSRPVAVTPWSGSPDVAVAQIFS